MLYVLFKSIVAPLEIINRNYLKSRSQASVITVLTAAIIGSVIAPTIHYFVYKSRHNISLDIGNMFIGLSVSALTWLAGCVLLWLLSKVFKKGISFIQVTSTWGLSYIPNLLCIIIYNILLDIPGLYSSSSVLTFVFGTFFIMLLVWKAIYYFMFLRFVIDTTLGEFLIITAVSAIVFAAFIMIGFNVGIQVPMV